MTSISSAGIQMTLLNNLENQQNTLVTLNEQLASGQQYDNLTQYDPTSAHQLLDLQDSITQRQSYLSSMTNVSAVLSVYDTSFTDMESINSGAVSLAQQSQSYSASNQAQIKTQVQSYMEELTSDLNQQVGNAYIFSGSRYNTAPVANIANLTTAPSTTTVSSPALPTYDSQYVDSSSTNANAYTVATANVDANYSISYGISSNNPAIQQLVSGLQYLNQAANATDQATYSSAISNALGLLSSSNTGLQTLHAGVADNQNLITSETTLQNNNITSLQNQIGNIQQVDTSTVGTEITLLQTQLQASYSATASLEQLSLVKYL